MIQYWPAAAFGAVSIYCVWVVWRALTQGTVRAAGLDWSRNDAPIAYWAFTTFHTVAAVLIIVGVIIRGPSALVSN